MANLKRKMKRQRPEYIKVPDCICAWAQNGDLVTCMCDGFWYGGTGRFNTGLPDCELPWLADKIRERLGCTFCYDYDDFLCVADIVIEEQKPVLVALAENGKALKRWGGIPTLFKRFGSRMFKQSRDPCEMKR